MIYLVAIKTLSLEKYTKTKFAYNAVLSSIERLGQLEELNFLKPLKRENFVQINVALLIIVASITINIKLD